MKRGLVLLLGLMIAVSLCIATARARAGTTASRGNRNPVVRVVTVSQAGLRRDGNEDLLEPTMERLNQGSSFRPDIACLPELFSNRSPEPVPGPVTERIAAWARAHSSYVVFGLKTERAGRVYNSAILIDRKGQIVGQYDKLDPTEGEIRDGTTPGDDTGPPVFKTGFGTIGIQICFDVNWRDQWRRLKQEGAQIVFWPSAYPAARQLPALAVLNEYYIVSSTGRASSSIYDITGEVLATTGLYQEWAGAALPLGERLFEVDYNAPKAQQIQQTYGSRVRVVWYHDSDWFTLASLDPNLTVEDLIKQYGLIPLDQYIVRSTRAVEQARAGDIGKIRAAK